VTIHVTPIPSTIELTTPAFTLGLTNVAGSSSSAVASDSTLLAFSATVPETITAGASSAAGSAETSARRDHVHGAADEYTTFAVPSFTLGTSNVTGSGDSVHAGATLLAFDAVLPDILEFGQSGEVGTAVVTSRRDHAHEMPAQPNLGSAMQNFVEGGLKCPYILGPIKKGSFSSGDNVGFGDAWEFGFTGAGGGLTQSTVITGGWRLTAGPLDSRVAWLAAGDAKISAADDFTVVYRLSRPTDGLESTYLGLATTPYAGNTSNDIIQFYWADTTFIDVITDNGGSQTVTTITSAAANTETTFRIEVSDDGGIVKFWLNNTLEATHTTDIPTSTAMYAYVVQKSNSGAATYLDVGDVFAWSNP